MGALVVWWLVVEGLGLVSLPLTARLFSARADGGYGFAKLVGLLIISYVSWVVTSIGVLPFHVALPATVAAFVVLNAALAWADRTALAQWWQSAGLRAVVTHDGFWTVGFLFFAWQRSLAPEIFGAEKYMDFAFFNTLTRTDVFPPADPWMAGQPFNYYYFGYLMLANVARLAPVANHIAYNLCVATVGGLAFAQAAAIGLMLTGRQSLAWVTGAATMLIGNLDGFLQLLERGGFRGFDYWRSSRIVANGDTINEFPYFTAIHGDLHPHYIVLPVSLLLLGLLLDPGHFGRRNGVPRRPADVWRLLPVAFVLASMIVISPWELPVGAMVVFLLMGRTQPVWPLVSWARLALAGTVGAMLVLGYVFYLPFYAHFIAPQGGVGHKFARTSLLEFLTVFGALLAPPALLLAGEVRKRVTLTREVQQLLVALGALATIVAYLAGNAVYVVLGVLLAAALVATYSTDDAERRGPLLLVVAATVALLACEVVYIKDPYGDKLYRMNTVFKLYLQSWLLLAVAAPWCVGELFARTAARQRSLVLGTCAALFLAACCYPIGITASRLGGRVLPSTLDGTAYLEREHPDDFAAIKWLRETVPGLPVVLEATGNPYSYYARVSSNTGLPTVMGWGNHEGLWRGHDRDVAQRAQDVAKLYTAATLDEVTGLLDRYRVEYVVVGELERKDHKGPGLEKFAALPVVFSQGGTTIYRR